MSLTMRPRMPVPISEIVELVGGRYDGPRDFSVRGVATLTDAEGDQRGDTPARAEACAGPPQCQRRHDNRPKLTRGSIAT